MRSTLLCSVKWDCDRMKPMDFMGCEGRLVRSRPVLCDRRSEVRFQQERVLHESVTKQSEKEIILMDVNQILAACDHTLLLQTATWGEIQGLLDDAIRYQTASVCIPPCYIAQAKEYAGDRMRICTVIGFPNGNMTTTVKVLETFDALDKGADEIDMVINIGRLKSKDYDYVKQEINLIKQACGDHILKVIIETCMLTDEEKIKMCEIVTEAGADFIKTSTGFSTSGATFADVELFAKHVGEGVKIKAAGGISSIADAEKFIELGASRLGTSRIVKIVKSMEQ